MVVPQRSLRRRRRCKRFGLLLACALQLTAQQYTSSQSSTTTSILASAQPTTATATASHNNNNNNNAASSSFLVPTPEGPIEDAHCNVEDLEEANDSQLYSILHDITKTQFFKTFQVDLNKKCPLAKTTTAATTTTHSHGQEEEDDSFECSGGAEELDVDAEPLCTVETGSEDFFATPSFAASTSTSSKNDYNNNNNLDSNALYSLSRAGFKSQEQKDTFSWNDHVDAVVKTPPTAAAADAPGGTSIKAKTDSTNKPRTLSLLTKHIYKKAPEDDDESCHDEQGLLPDDFWLDLCHHDNDNDNSLQTIDLTLNPERNTGYNGTHIWKAIYEENCVATTSSSGNVFASSEEDQCSEQRVLYKLLSALHTSTTVSIAVNYYPPSKRKKRVDWESNPQYFMQQFQHSPEYIRNLHFTYVVLLRALSKAAPYLRTYDLRTGNVVQDETATVLLHRLLDSSILESCSSVFAAFDESIMFQPDNSTATSNIKNKDVIDDTTLRPRVFKGVFHNVTSILNCVQCQQCKLHGKLVMLGYGTALKILFVKKQELLDLTRNEVVALINTIAKMSEAIRHVRTLTRLYVDGIENVSITRHEEDEAETVLATSPGSNEWNANVALSDSAAVDQVVRLAASLGRKGHIGLDVETRLVHQALQRNMDLMILAKYYGNDLDKFLHMLKQTHIMEGSDENPDVIVVGSGLAGLAAALNVLDRGGRVVIVEKEHLLGGNSNKASSGINACCPNNGTVEDTRESFWNDTLKSAGSSARPELIEVLINNSASAVTWLKERAGVDLSLVAQLGGHTAKRTHRPSNGMAGAEIIYGIQKAVKAYESSGKVKIILDTKVTGLSVDKQGRVTGVKVASTKSLDEERELFAPNVVLATGGFAADRSVGSFLEKYRPELLKMPTTAGDFSTGDGVSLASSLGAGLVDMDKVQVHPTGWIDPVNPNATTKILAAELMRGVGGILLNEEGSRFCNELGTRAYVTTQMLSHDPKFAKSGKWDANATIPTFYLILSSSAAADGKKHVDLYTHKGLMTQVQGIESLSNYTGLSEKKLRQTMRQYQSDAKQGADKFGKTSFRGVPGTDLDKETFYVGRICPVLHYCMGGITIDKEGNVLKESGDLIPGLHAAGEVTGGVHGVNRLGGNSLLECTVFGTIVGKKLPIKAVSQAITQSSRVREKAPTYKELRTVSPSELEKHNTPEDCWVAVYDVVYDLTDFAEGL